MYKQRKDEISEKYSIKNFLNKCFSINNHGSSIKTELRAGITTFMAMAYIIVVNPIILSAAGMDYKSIFLATCMAAAVSTFLMGMVAKKPFGMAAGLGINSLVAFGVIVNMHQPWQIAMGLIFIEGFIVFLLVLTNLREMIMNSIPPSLKISIGVGIGMFISFIGFKIANIMVPSPENLIQFGNVFNPVFIVSILGLTIIGILMALKVKGSIFYGIVLTSFVAVFACFIGDFTHTSFNVFGNPNIPISITSLPAGSSNIPCNWNGHFIEIPTFQNFSTIGKLDIKGCLSLSFVPVIFALMMVDFFDSLGTVMALGTQAGLVDNKGKLRDIKKILAIDALGAMIGGFMGSSSNTAYVESSAGIIEGGKTGLTSVVVAGLFFMVMFFVPLAYFIPSAAIAPALIVVGFLMISMINNIDWDDFEESLPSFLTIITMTFTFSISKGIGFGFISYCVIKLANGKWREVKPLMWIVSIIFVVYFLSVANLL
ncbi:NCS2 family permease [Methanobacterium alcaliphilum]|uniref:NCS2 family permease n=1 Tax=Methanobacterium alcaliphilum TaxID=392018 RepID=UPI002009F206|nr:NCS2 family permease [Methanobacterium alcaliphilum]MCK9150590.1 NCS2 family permease [Methanobacterium alcaliphilum]